MAIRSMADRLLFGKSSEALTGELSVWGMDIRRARLAQEFANLCTVGGRFTGYQQFFETLSIGKN